MRALRFLEPGNVALSDVSDPEPGPGEAILRVHATGLCNSDVRVYLGEKKAAPGVIPGHEVTGDLFALGPGADPGMPLGTTVSLCPILCCGRCTFCRDGFRNRCPSRKTLGYDLDGGIAEFVRVPAPLVAMGHLLPVDPSTAPEVRALVEPLACVLNSLESLSVHAGRPFAIVGAGPMGLLHLVAASAYGAGPIAVIEPDAARRQIALSFGADVALPPEESAAALDLVQGEGYPSVAMAVGFAEVLPVALQVVSRLGAINLFAGFPPGSIHQLDLNRVHYDEICLLGTQNAPFPLYARSATLVTRLQRELAPIVTHRYTLDSAAEAYSARLAKDGLKSAVVVADR